MTDLPFMSYVDDYINVTINPTRHAGWTVSM